MPPVDRTTHELYASSLKAAHTAPEEVRGAMAVTLVSMGSVAGAGSSTSPPPASGRRDTWRK